MRDASKRGLPEDLEARYGADTEAMSALIREMRELAENRYFPMIRESGAVFLAETVKKEKPRNILELGCGIGYTGILMLLNSSAELLTIEKDAARIADAEEFMIRAGLFRRAVLAEGDAAEILRYLDRKFDFVFVDAAKGQYPEFFKLIEPLLSERATVLFDNVGYHALVGQGGAVAHRARTIVTRLRAFLKEATENPRYESEYFPEISDGMLVMRRVVEKD